MIVVFSGGKESRVCTKDVGSERLGWALRCKEEPRKMGVTVLACVMIGVPVFAGSGVGCLMWLIAVSFRPV